MASIFFFSANRLTPLLSLCATMFISASCGLLASASSNAHELWIAPQSAPIETGDVLDIDIFVGENFEGNAQIYLPRRTELLAIASTEGVSDIQPRIGSRPAINFVAEADGHVMLMYQSADEYVHYTHFEIFADFITEKKAGDILAQHQSRGLPETHFTERYKRFAKASMFIGTPNTNSIEIAPNDTDMELEFILLQLNQAQSEAQEAHIRLTYQGEAVPQAPISLLIKSEDQQVTQTPLLTDNNGEIIITTLPLHQYLLDHVLVRPLDPKTDANSAIWESLWASLSFSRVVQP